METEYTANSICQSCGMPMAAVEHFGTNKDSSTNSDYCCFCYQNGNYTDVLDFDDFLEENLKFHTGTGGNGFKPTKDEISIKERVKLSVLKRWNIHQKTHLEYYKAIDRVVNYINDHLSANIILSDLACIANISEFHFHRIFRAVINESPGDYIQRLRLEKTAFKLQTTQSTLEQIAEETGYQSPQALSKAFKKRYGISPSVYRKRPDDLTSPMEEPIPDMYIVPQIKEVAPKEVLCLRVTNPFKSSDAFLKAWDKLTSQIGINIIPNDDCEFFCLSRDISTITHPENYRVYVCINTQKDIKPKGKPGKQIIGKGLYAVFTYKGSYKNLRDIYCNIYRYWIPKSDYELRDNISFEKYLNSPLLVDSDELLTEIYIPVNKIT